MAAPNPRQLRILAITRLIGALAAALVLGYATLRQLFAGAALQGQVLWLCVLTVVALAYALWCLSRLERLLRAQGAAQAGSK